MMEGPGETTNSWDVEGEVVAGMYDELQQICGDESSGLPFDVSLATDASAHDASAHDARAPQ